MGISKGTMVAATRREAWFLLLSLILGVQAMPMSLDSGAQVFLAEVASQDPGTGELNCHTKTDQSDKLAKWEQSETKRIFEEGVRQCTNSPNAYKLPEDSRATANREQAQEEASDKKESADAAASSATDAIQKQGEAMADYVKVANGIDAENAKANAAEAEVEKAAIEKAQADEEVQLSEQNTLATDQEATDATAELENAETQASGAEKALQDAKDEFTTQKTAMDERIAELKETEEDTLDAKTTADDAAQAAQDGYDSETEEVAKAAALASVESTKSEAEA